MKRTARLQIQVGADRQDTGTSISSALPSASHVDLPSLYPGPCLTCWTARQPRHSPPSATPPVLPRRDSQGGGGHHDFALVLHRHGAHVPVWRAATARDGQLREHLLCVGATCSRLLRPQPLYSCRHGALQPALPSSIPQEHALCLRYVPLLSIRPHPVCPSGPCSSPALSPSPVPCGYRWSSRPEQAGSSRPASSRRRWTLSSCRPSSWRRRRTLSSSPSKSWSRGSVTLSYSFAP